MTPLHVHQPTNLGMNVDTEKELLGIIVFACSNILEDPTPL